MQQQINIKVLIQSDDKIPNLDGRIELLKNVEKGTKKIPIRIFHVQVKTLNGEYYNENKIKNKSQYKYSVDTKVLNVVKENITSDPVLLFLVDTNNKKVFWFHISKEKVMNIEITESEGMKHDEIMYNYFSNPASDAPYLIAERYISFIASTVKSGVIEIPDQCKKVIANYQELQSIISSPSFGMMDPSTQAALIKQKEKAGRVPEALIANNNKAGYDIFKNEKIYIKNTNDLTMYEKYAILMSHTSTVTFNSFAAEVKFHAVALKDFFSFSGWYYEKAIRADIAIGEEYESGVFDAYYNLNSDLVKEQIKYHGEY